MPAPPTGTVTFLFTDMEGSTRLWELYPDAMPLALARHDALLRYTFENLDGCVFKTMGDAFCTAFGDVTQALEATIAAQFALQNEDWQKSGLPSQEKLRVRMALHTGTAQQRNSDYFGPTVNRVSRLIGAAQGGQILLSGATHGLVCDFLPPGVELRDMGQRRLKDLPRPEQIFQVVVPGLQAEFPPLRTLDDRPSNLPAWATSFVGREREISAVRSLLRRSEVRLVTMTGPGGTGKTRLSVRVAADLLDEFEDGVLFVALASVNTAPLMISILAQILEVKETPGQPLLESLKSWLHTKQILLVLDNFEQMVAAAPLLTELLQVAPRLKILVSSREVLNLYGEFEFDVPPLALPDLQSSPSLEKLLTNEAISLFGQRAQAVKPDFKLMAANIETIAQICAKLDGLPLAIELAAVRSKQFTPNEMLVQLNSKLGGSLELLAVGPRDLPARQRTLRGAIDWSYQLLDEDEKQLFERLAVFVGGWSATAADVVCHAVSTSPSNTLPGSHWAQLWIGMTSLADKSLIRQVEHQATINTNEASLSSNGFQSFMMLQTIREFALEKLVMRGEKELIERQHARFYVELAETAEPELRGPQQLEWMNRLEAEHDNLRAALNWLINNDTAPDIEAALRLAGSLRWFWQMHNYLSEGRQWLETVLVKDSNHLSISARAKAFNSAGVLASKQADYQRANDLLRQSLKLQRLLKDERGVANTLINLGNVAVMRGDYEQAQSFFTECLIIQRQLEDKRGIADTLGNLGVVALYQGNYAEAQPFFKEGLNLQRDLQNKSNIAGALLNLGCVMLYQGEYEQGATFFRESLELFRELGNKLHLAEALEGMAGIFGAQMQAEGAAQLFGAAEGLRESVGAPLSPSDQLFYEPLLDMTRKLLGDEPFKTAWKTGRDLSAEQALTLALS